MVMNLNQTATKFTPVTNKTIGYYSLVFVNILIEFNQTTKVLKSIKTRSSSGNDEESLN